MFGITWKDIELYEKLQQAGMRVADMKRLGLSYSDIDRMTVQDLKLLMSNH